MKSIVATFRMIAGSCGLVSSSLAAVPVGQDGALNVYGDARLRLESDWASTDSAGVERADRTRLRTRLRLGLALRPRAGSELGLRVRSGSALSQQSPHITILDFDGNDTGPADFSFDKWFWRQRLGAATLTVGRSDLPFWRQNELFWDDDVTPAGIAVSWLFDGVEVHVGEFSLPAGAAEFSGKLSAAQLVVSRALGTAGSVKGGLGLLAIDGQPDDADGALLLDGNGARDYEVWILSCRYEMRAKGWLWTVGFDLARNGQDYSGADPGSFTGLHRDDTDGRVLFVNWGPAPAAASWRMAYFYADIGTLAASSSYTQDDWLRWGSADQTRSTNFSGHELRFTRALAEDVNVVARFYSVGAKTRRSVDSTALEDGKRLRVDLNYRF